MVQLSNVSVKARFPQSFIWDNFSQHLLTQIQIAILFSVYAMELYNITDLQLEIIWSRVSQVRGYILLFITKMRTY